MEFTNQQFRDGERLLRQLLPKAKAMGNITTRAKSGLAEACLPYVRESNLQAVMIHQPPTGGWIADVLLRDVPPGVSNVFGTPVGTPLSSRHEALDSAVMILSHVLSFDKQTTANPARAEPVFEYHDAVFTLDAALMGLLASHGARYESLKHAHKRLDEITLQLFPEGYSFDRFEALSDEAKRILLSVIHLAALTCVLRYPVLTPGKPKMSEDID